MGATATIANFWHDVPPRLGNPSEYKRARRVFEDSGYSYANLCSRFGVERLFEYKMPPAEEILAQPVADPLGAMIRLFAHGLHLDRAIVERLLSAESRAALYALHLLDVDPERPNMDFAPAVVFPFLDVLTISDRFCMPSGGDVTVPVDAVYPALFDNTYNFVTRLPETPCDALLDLGTGTGVAAIRQARLARRVWATDITARSVYFADFNRRLNGLDNVEALEGDLYAPVRGLTFDRIATQPPYVAVETDKLAYRDGGRDGEQIFRRIVEGLPEFLRPGGTCYALLMATDREGETFEQRIRKWLGERAEEFDILFGCDLSRDPMEFLLAAQKITPAEKEYRRVMYRNTRTRAVLYGSVVIRRKLESRPAVTTRMFLGKGVTGKHLDDLLEWNAAVNSPAAAEMLWNARPRLGVHCELHTTHRVRNGRLAPEDFELQTTGPFLSKGKTPPWVAQMVAECDGSQTWGERFDKLTAAKRIPPGVTPEDFARMLAVLVSTGVLDLSQNEGSF
jgi:SAM-dependent methyltransferase